MTHQTPTLSDPLLGAPVSSNPALTPQPKTLTGQYITLKPIEPTFSKALFATVGGLENASLWTYIPTGPFTEYQAFADYINPPASPSSTKAHQHHSFAIFDNASGHAAGLISHVRIDTANRVLEVGVLYGTQLQRTRGATESIYLLGREVFETCGFRRWEWKCNNLNETSKRAAERLGFVFEGVSRQHLVVKGRNRDSAWYSMLDGEWPLVSFLFFDWLERGNFDEGGRQRVGLKALREGMSSMVLADGAE